MTIGCKACKGATPAGAALPRQADQPGSSRAAASRKSARAHRRTRRTVQAKAIARLVPADEEMVCADEQQVDAWADDPGSCREDNTVLKSQKQGTAFAALVSAAAAAASSCASVQQCQAQATKAKRSAGNSSDILRAQR